MVALATISDKHCATGVCKELYFTASTTNLCDDSLCYFMRDSQSLSDMAARTWPILRGVNVETEQFVPKLLT